MRVIDCVMLGASCMLTLSACVMWWWVHHRSDSVNEKQARQFEVLMRTRDDLALSVDQYQRALAIDFEQSGLTAWEPENWQARAQQQLELVAGPSSGYAFAVLPSDLTVAPEGVPLIWHSVPWTLDAKARHGISAIALLDVLDVALGGISVDGCVLEKIRAGVSLTCSGYKQALESVP